MGLFDKLFGSKVKSQTSNYKHWKTFTEFDPVFAPFTGTVYEQELTRASIDRFSLACSKLKPEIRGSSKQHIAKLINTRPNDQMTWSNFMARLANIYQIDCMAYIVPGFSRDMTRIEAFFPLKCDWAEVLEYNGEPWIRFNFSTGDTAVIELKYVGLLARYPYQSDYFSEPHCIKNTMDLINAQNQALQAAIKAGAKIRFIGAVNGRVHEDDLKKKRERFVKDNFSPENENGILIYDSTFTDVKQVNPQSFVIDDDEMKRIEKAVYTYFGTNEAILTNSFNEEQWLAYYEGVIEPFAVRVGEAMTNMVFSATEQMHENRISFSSNRLEYASANSKRQLISEMVDRSIMSLNEGREMLQLPPVDGGDKRVIRGEYINVDALSSTPKIVEPTDPKEPDDSNNDDVKIGEDDADQR